MKQLSAFPDEVPDQDIKTRKRSFRSLRSRLESYLKKNGPYAFCKCVQSLSANKSECEKFGVTQVEARGAGEDIFGSHVGFTDNIDSFLKKIKERPGYKMPVFEK